MGKFGRYLMCLIMMCMLIFGAESVLAAEEDYPVKVWSADDMEIGNTTGADGLEFLQPTDTTATKVQVQNGGRAPFVNAIKTGGASSMLDAYVPKTRALKFTVTKPCNIRIYAYGASSNGTVNMKVSSAEKIVDTFNTQHSTLNKYVTYLDSAGTYYIYGNASLGICEVAVGYAVGDADFDFDRDWNDMRILRKVVFDNLSVNEMIQRNIDVDNNGRITSNDTACMDSYMLDDDKGEYNKAKFISYAQWNANDMAAGCPVTYNNLEFVYADNDIANRSIFVASCNKTYTSQNGEAKAYAKCIQTDGDTGKAVGNYPVTKAVKFNLEQEGYVTLYLSTGSSKAIQHKAQIINADGQRVAEFDIDKNIGCYVTKLSGNETYFVSSNTGTLRIYEIEIRQNSNKSCSKTINVEAGKTYCLYLTADKGVMTGKIPVKLTYNTAAVTAETMGAGSKIAVGNCNDRTRITETGAGYIVFEPYGWKDGEGGIMTDIVFKANSTGVTTLTLSMQEG